MTSRVIVPPKLASETRTDAIDFGPDLAAGQSLASVAAAVTVYSGTDPTPGGVVASATISGQSVNVRYGPSVEGVIYAVRLEATTASPAGIITKSYYLASIPELP